MNLDIRFPLGLMFAIMGVILVATGLLSGARAHAGGETVNINLWWGLALTVFGGVTLLLASRAARKD